MYNNQILGIHVIQTNPSRFDERLLTLRRIFVRITFETRKRNTGIYVLRQRVPEKERERENSVFRERERENSVFRERERENSVFTEREREFRIQREREFQREREGDFMNKGRSCIQRKHATQSTQCINISFYFTCFQLTAILPDT